MGGGADERPGLQADASQVLITTGSQQGLDLAAKVLIDADSLVAVESPTYLGALQAFAPYEPRFQAVECDDEGPLPDGLDAVRGARFLYVLPNFQNPSGRCIGAARREAIVEQTARLKLPLIEDNPYGDLWFDEPPPAPLASLAPDRVLYLGSFSKVLAPGLRLGYLVAPKTLFPKLLQAKQAADLHTPGYNQRLVHEVIKNGFLDQHVPTIRARYKAHRDAMRSALDRHLGDFTAPNGDRCRWNVPVGGMFFWVNLPRGLDAAGAAAPGGGGRHGLRARRRVLLRGGAAQQLAPELRHRAGGAHRSRRGAIGRGAERRLRGAARSKAGIAGHRCPRIRSA